MTWIFFLLLLISNGVIFSNSLLNKKSPLQIPTVFILGSIISVSSVYFFTLLMGTQIEKSLSYYFLLSIFLVFIFKDHIKSFAFDMRSNLKELFVFYIIATISYLVFQKSFSYDSNTANILVASNLYVDFSSHIAFIRSFSMGQNIPFEAPFFSGHTIMYHFMFNFFAGILEYMGLRIDIALNLISGLALSSLCFLLYNLSTNTFKSRIVGLVAVILSLFNSTLAFLYFFIEKKLDLSIIPSILHNSFYIGNAPFDSSLVSGFWNFNTFLNQRHLIFGIAFFLFIISCFLERADYDRKSILLLVILIGIFPFWHISVFICIFIFLFIFTFLRLSSRKIIFFILAFSLFFAGFELFKLAYYSENRMLFKPGFLVHDNLSVISFIVLWIYNLGFSLITLLFGFFISNKNAKMVFLSFSGIFIFANLFQVNSFYMYDNHKFFNIWILGMNIFSAGAIVYLYKGGIGRKLLSGALLVVLVLSGIINSMVIKNDVYAQIPDYPKNTFLQWVMHNTPKNSLYLTNGEIYDPINTIGRKTTIGREYTVLLYGKNPTKELRDQRIILLGEDEELAIRIAHENKIGYIIVYKSNFAKNIKSSNTSFLTNTFTKIYEDEYGSIFKI